MRGYHRARWCWAFLGRSSENSVLTNSLCFIDVLKIMSATPANIATSRSLLRLYKQLLTHFGPRNWWPADRAWEMMVGAILVQNTAWTNVEKAIASLKSAHALTLNRI